MKEGSQRPTTETWEGHAPPADGHLPNLPPRWRLERLLGCGGQADVWLAHDEILGQPIAIKVFRGGLDAVSRERLRREVKIGRTLQHNRLVRLFEVVEAEDRLAVAMEWVPGGTVADRVAGGPLSIDEVVRIANETLEALEYLSEHDVIHRDVKPSNLLLDSQGGVRLADFGLARSLVETSDLTRTALGVGTPGYMSPEQIRGIGVGPASDLYSLGVTLYHAITGITPFRGPSAFDVAQQHFTKAPPDPGSLRSDCPRWLSAFVLRLLEKHPQDRFKSASDASRSLAERKASALPRLRKRRWALATSAAVVTLATVLSWGPLTSTFQPRLTARVEVLGRQARGLDLRGRTVWRQSFASPIQQALQADLTGDGRDETILAIYPSPTENRTRNTPSEVVVLDPAGNPLTRVHPEQLLKDWPFEFPRAFNLSFRPLDLGDGGRQTLVVLATHRAFYPSVLFAYWAGAGAWEPLFMNSGALVDSVAVPGSHPPRLRFFGVNNEIGFLHVVGELEIPPPRAGDSTPMRTLWVLASDSNVGREDARLQSYTLCGQFNVEALKLTLGPGGESILRSSTGEHRLDLLGNPVPGPNAGRDLRARRLAFVKGIAFLMHRAPRFGTSDVATKLSELRELAGPLLAEPPYRAMLALFAARGFARSGDLATAVRLLEEVVRDDSFEDVTYRLAHLQAVSGRLEDALLTLKPLVRTSRTGRDYDAAQLALRLLVESRSSQGFESLASDLAGGRSHPDRELAARQAFSARAHFWWDELTETDCRTGSWLYMPEGDAVACLARWRLGKLLPTDPRAMEASLRDNPDAAGEIRIALGAAILGLGRPADAVVELTRAVEYLLPRSHDDYFDRQSLDLARAIQAKALLAAGETGRALELARRVRTSLRPRLLPRILVDEVLAGAPAGP